MAQPSTEINQFRQRVVSALDSFIKVQQALVIIQATGANDTERQAALLPFFQANPDYDISAQDLLTARNALLAIEATIDANLVALAKVRI